MDRLVSRRDLGSGEIEHSGNRLERPAGCPWIGPARRRLGTPGATGRGLFRSGRRSLPLPRAAGPSRSSGSVRLLLPPDCPGRSGAGRLDSRTRWQVPPARPRTAESACRASSSRSCGTFCSLPCLVASQPPQGPTSGRWSTSVVRGGPQAEAGRRYQDSFTRCESESTRTSSSDWRILEAPLLPCGVR